MDIGRELRVIQVARATSLDVAFEMDTEAEKTIEAARGDREPDGTFTTSDRGDRRTSAG